MDCPPSVSFPVCVKNYTTFRLVVVLPFPDGAVAVELPVDAGLLDEPTATFSFIALPPLLFQE